MEGGREVIWFYLRRISRSERGDGVRLERRWIKKGSCGGHYIAEMRGRRRGSL